MKRVYGGLWIQRWSGDLGDLHISAINGLLFQSTVILVVTKVSLDLVPLPASIVHLRSLFALLCQQYPLILSLPTSPSSIPTTLYPTSHYPTSHYPTSILYPTSTVYPASPPASLASQSLHQPFSVTSSSTSYITLFSCGFTHELSPQTGVPQL